MSVVTLLNQKESLQRIRALGPTIIFCATSLLMVISIFGTVVAFSIFRVQITNANTGASPCLILLSVRAQKSCREDKANTIYQVSGFLRLRWAVSPRCSKK